MDKDNAVDERWKTIIILSGDKTGKTIFDKTIKSDGYWVWNINPSGVAKNSAKHLGWDYPEKDDRYYNFIDDLVSLSDEYWDFRFSYYLDMISKFNNDENPNVLVLHGCDGDLADRIMNVCPGITFRIHIHSGNDDMEQPVELFDKTLYVTSIFERELLKTMSVLTKKLGDK